MSKTSSSKEIFSIKTYTTLLPQFQPLVELGRLRKGTASIGNFLCNERETSVSNIQEGDSGEQQPDEAVTTIIPNEVDDAADGESQERSANLELNT